ncbi:toll/interleukin-1 receptor domain-containing protein [Bacillus cereus]|uniref:toll/interleukin-1 receptor domain-containing protein n=2 Tax=Bacillus thuringiensis TaxID=1428 RepID=UPI0004499546|nr:toll/interleukin-1 receptor domain-containing protein [Bacillus thuringiensis]MEB8637501.1 toll/interleukin-1 receptor domain-containing protein [Bacillus cereus]EXY04788.1 hypothetical protein BF15_06740 [Bacillus thuringiensis]MEB8741696.1 toll/interleukin-1 receptor domain-containing protein [Bacillus cereus]MEB8799226.1 toll/interleukin-1 receptor domain-containing protein [Bacillus cereus]MEB8809654.1 toll/interleukin-1 receptor domain-containing protein [Bacillus cereus]
MSEIKTNSDTVDFFISYNHKDEEYAEWISWILEDAGYTTIVQAWDFKSGQNFAVLMHQAASKSRHTLALVSNNYLGSQFTLAEWISAFADDPTGERQKLIPIRIEDIKLEGLLKAILYIDLVGKGHEEAAAAILEGVQTKRKKTTTPPPFPGIIPKNTEVQSFSVEGEWYKPWVESRLKEIEIKGPYHKIKDGAKLVVHLIPIEAITSSKTYDLKELRLPLDLEPFCCLGWNHDINKHGFLTYAQFSVSDLPHSYVQLHRSGIIEAIDRELLNGRDKYIPAVAFEQKIITLIENCYMKELQKLGVKFPFVINLTLIDVKEYYISMNPKFNKGTIQDDVLQLPPVLINSWEENIAKALKPSFDYLWNTCGVAESPNFDSNGKYKKDPHIY